MMIQEYCLSTWTEGRAESIEVIVSGLTLDWYCINALRACLWPIRPVPKPAMDEGPSGCTVQKNSYDLTAEPYPARVSGDSPFHRK
jgi:hypothetical protein